MGRVIGKGPMPRHGHKWINILQKEGAADPGMIDHIAYVPTMWQPTATDGALHGPKPGDAIKKAAGRHCASSTPEKSQRAVRIWGRCLPRMGTSGWNEELRGPRRPGHSMPISSDDGWQQERAATNPVRTGRPWRAISVEDEEDGPAGWGEEGLEVIRPELGSKPAGLYTANLWALFENCFIGGSIRRKAGGVIDCVEGASNTGPPPQGTASPDERKRPATNYGIFKVRPTRRGFGQNTSSR